jgi:hypothetical protein
MNRRPDPTLFLAVTPSMRDRIEAAIEGLLQLLDALDGDADLEPTLGAPEMPLPDCRHYLADIFPDTSQERWAAGYGDDLELDPGDDGLADEPGFVEQRGYNWGIGQ